PAARQLTGYSDRMKTALKTAILVMLCGAAASAQGRLKDVPGYADYQRMSREIPTAVKSGALSAAWDAESKTLEYMKDGKRYRFDMGTRRITEAEGAGRAGAAGHGAGGDKQAGGEAPDRGRQYTIAMSPDGAKKALYRDSNCYLSAADGSNQEAITTDGDENVHI